MALVLALAHALNVSPSHGSIRMSFLSMISPSLAIGTKQSPGFVPLRISYPRHVTAPERSRHGLVWINKQLLRGWSAQVFAELQVSADVGARGVPKGVDIGERRDAAA